MKESGTQPTFIACEQVEWAFRCTQQWEALIVVSDQVRHCAHCDAAMHFCASLDELSQHCRHRHCVAFVAVDNKPVDKFVVTYVGNIDTIYKVGE